MAPSSSRCQGYLGRTKERVGRVDLVIVPTQSVRVAGVPFAMSAQRALEAAKVLDAPRWVHAAKSSNWADQFDKREPGNPGSPDSRVEKREPQLTIRCADLSPLINERPVFDAPLFNARAMTCPAVGRGKMIRYATAPTSAPAPNNTAAAVRGCSCAATDTRVANFEAAFRARLNS